MFIWEGKFESLSPDTLAEVIIKVDGMALANARASRYTHVEKKVVEKKNKMKSKLIRTTAAQIP